MNREERQSIEAFRQQLIERFKRERHLSHMRNLRILVGVIIASYVATLPFVLNFTGGRPPVVGPGQWRQHTPQENEAQE